MKKNIILAMLVLFAAGFFFWAWNRSSNRSLVAANNPLSGTASAVTSEFARKTDSSGWAEIEVLPLALASSEWSFEVTLNAHQEMSVDLTKAVTLTDDRGDTLAPLRWDEPNPGGHHRNGTLVFKAPSSVPKNITITMRDVGGAATRTFSWDLPKEN